MVEVTMHLLANLLQEPQSLSCLFDMQVHMLCQDLFVNPLNRLSILACAAEGV